MRITPVDAADLPWAAFVVSSGGRAGVVAAAVDTKLLRSRQLSCDLDGAGWCALETKLRFGWRNERRQVAVPHRVRHNMLSSISLLSDA